MIAVLNCDADINRHVTITPLNIHVNTYINARSDKKKTTDWDCKQQQKIINGR